MLKKKFYSKRYVHGTGAMNTMDTAASNRIHSLRNPCCGQVVKKMPDYNASKHTQDVKQKILECSNQQKFGTISGNDVILCNGDILTNAAGETCKIMNVGGKEIGVYTKDLTTRTASEHIAYNKASRRVIEKPIDMPNLAVHIC